MVNFTCTKMLALKTNSLKLQKKYYKKHKMEKHKLFPNNINKFKSIKDLNLNI